MEDIIDEFFGKLYPNKLNYKYGYIDKTGREVTPIKYDYAGNFREEEAEVMLNGIKFKIDKNGKIVK